MNYIEAIRRSIASSIRTHRAKLNDALLAKRLAGNLEYSFTTDYVSCLTSIWEQHLAGFKGKDNIRFLEIGSFEGRSTIWFLENILSHPTSSITCVDNFSRQGGEPRFDHNIKVSGFSNKVTKIKGRSEDVLRTLNENTFDIIYIDGNHYALNVLMDTVLSWLLLKPGGIIIFDDYEWEPKRLPLERPKTAINIFIQAFQTQIEVLHKGWQVIIRKIESVNPDGDSKITIRGADKLIEPRGSTDQTVTPLVSVIIPAYNAEAFLQEAIESVQRQNYSPIEIIIVEDGSTDRTAQIVASAGDNIRYFYQDNGGPAAARNKGLRMAHGEIIGFLDSDDLWPGDKLHTQVRWLVNNPKIDVVMGRVQYVGLFTPRESKIPFESPDKTLVNINLGAGVFRKEVFNKVGTFDETLRYSEDQDWFLRAREQGISITIIDKVTLYYRLHEHNMTRTKNTNSFQLTKVLKKSLDRRRNQNHGEVQLLTKFSDFDEAKTSSSSDREQKEIGLLDRPTISVIIPVYNGERYLGEAIESVLAQTYRSIEIIVIDDGSTDSSAKVAKRFGKSVQYVFRSNSGTGAARNQGTNLATGDFFAFIDQDDIWMEDKLERQMSVFAPNPEAEMVFGHVQQFHSPELREDIKQKIYCPVRLMPGYLPSAMLVKRSSFFRVGLFETTWKIGEWANWYVRAVELGLKKIMLPELVMLRRLHERNKGLCQAKEVTEYARILKASLDRRRKKN